MDLQDIKLSEISEIKKNTNFMVSLMCEKLKNKTNEETRKHIHSYRYRGKNRYLPEGTGVGRKVGEGD